METLKLRIDAPNAKLVGNVRSILCNSFIHCRSLDLTLPESFNEASIYNSRSGEFIEKTEGKPTLNLLA
jgi:hypothetical protein